MPKLNIIFHGTFVFSLNKDKKRYEVEVPELPGHVYLGGNWLGELELPPKKGEKRAVLELRGVVAADDIVEGKNTLDESRNLVVPREKHLLRTRAPSGPESCFHSRRVSRLPQPWKWTEMHDIEQGKDQLKTEKFKVGALQIFTYDKANEDPDDQLRVVGNGRH